jgi:hypothetical protein
MFGRTNIEQLNLRKQALVLESSLNRQAVVLEAGELRSAASWVSSASRVSQRVAPFLMVLAPLAGLLAVRRARQPISMISRLAKLAKWIGPAYSIWRSFSAARKPGSGASLL